MELRIYYLPYAINWARVQLLATPSRGETGNDGLGRRVLFRNAVLANLAHLKVRSGDGTAIFESLVVDLSSGASFCGLESIYLTLLAVPAVRQLPAYAQSINLWNSRAPGITADAGTMFYNATDDRLSLLLPKTLETLKPGGVHSAILTSGDALATGIEAVADTIISAPFSMTPVVRATADNGPQRAELDMSPQAQAMSNELNLVAAVLAGTAAVLSVIPGGQIGAAIFAVASAGTWGLASSSYVTNLSPSNSTSTTAPGDPPPDAPVCSPDGTPQSALSSQPPDDDGDDGGDDPGDDPAYEGQGQGTNGNWRPPGLPGGDPASGDGAGGGGGGDGGGYSYSTGTSGGGHGGDPAYEGQGQDGGGETPKGLPGGDPA